MIKLDNLPLILYLATLPLVSFGSQAGSTGMVWAGLACLVVASLVSPTLRLMKKSD